MSVNLAAAMAATDSVAETKPRLIPGTEMTCPRCEVSRNILDFQRMQDGDPKYAHELAPVYKCPRQRGGCGMFFAPSDHAVVQTLIPASVKPEEVNFE
jgi:hypothetical protein